MIFDSLFSSFNLKVLSKQLVKCPRKSHDASWMSVFMANHHNHLYFIYFIGRKSPLRPISRLTAVMNLTFDTFTAKVLPRNVAST